MIVDYEGWVLNQPMGTSMPFQFVAVDHFADWAMYTKMPAKVTYKGVFKGNEMEFRDDIFNETVNMVKMEEWRLVDLVMAPAPYYRCERELMLIRFF